MVTEEAGKENLTAKKNRETSLLGSMPPMLFVFPGATTLAPWACALTLLTSFVRVLWQHPGCDETSSSPTTLLRRAEQRDGGEQYPREGGDGPKNLTLVCRQARERSHGEVYNIGYSRSLRSWYDE